MGRSRRWVGGLLLAAAVVPVATSNATARPALSPVWGVTHQAHMVRSPIGISGPVGLAAGFGRWLLFTDPSASTVGRIST